MGNLIRKNMFASYEDYRNGIKSGTVLCDDNVIGCCNLNDGVVIVSSSGNKRNNSHYEEMKILPPKSKKMCSFAKMVNIIQEVLGKNKDLKKIYKGSVGWNKPEAEEAARLLIQNHLQTLPVLLNNRKKLTEVLVMERLL